MKRLLSLFILISFASAIGLAQSASKTERHGQIWVVNTGPASIDVKCERIEVDIANSSYNYFCWDACYSPSTDVSVGTLPIAIRLYTESNGLFSLKVRVKHAESDGDPST